MFLEKSPLDPPESVPWCNSEYFIDDPFQRSPWQNATIDLGNLKDLFRFQITDSRKIPMQTLLKQ